MIFQVKVPSPTLNRIFDCQVRIALRSGTAGPNLIQGIIRAIFLGQDPLAILHAGDTQPKELFLGIRVLREAGLDFH